MPMPSPDAAPRLHREVLQPLLLRRDGPGLLRISVQLSAFAVASAATIAFGEHWGWIPSVIVAGTVLATLFPPLHEAGHRTAFATPLFNELTVWIGAILMLQSPTFFREFHFAHHRDTQDPTRDPEIAGAPGLLSDWPRNPLTYLGLASGQALWLGKAMFTLSCAVLPTSLMDKLYPFVRPKERRKVVWESRLVVGLWALVIGWAVLDPHVGRWLLAWPIAHLWLGLYLMPEHTGLPDHGDQSDRTRTIDTNAVVRWWMWNMPCHAVHHVHPAIPFHALPEAQRRLPGALRHRTPGYLAFHLEALRRSFGRR